MHDEKAIACLSIGKWKWHCGDLQSFVKVYHASCDFLKGPRQNWCRNCEDAILDAIHNELLHPLEDQLNLAITFANCYQTLLIKRFNVDEILPEQISSIIHASSTIEASAGVLYLCHRSTMEQTEKAQKFVPEHEDLIALAIVMSAESDERTACIKPLRSHLVHGSTSLPEPVVGLLRAKNNKETNQETKTSPDRIICEDTVSLLEPKERFPFIITHAHHHGHGYK